MTCEPTVHINGPFHIKDPKTYFDSISKETKRCPSACTRVVYFLTFFGFYRTRGLIHPDLSTSDLIWVWNFNFGKKWTSRLSSSFITVNQRKSFSFLCKTISSKSKPKFCRSPPAMVGYVHEYNLEIDQPIRPSRTTDQAYSSRVDPGSKKTPVARVCRRRRLNREVIQLRLQKLRHRVTADTTSQWSKAFETHGYAKIRLTYRPIQKRTLL